MVKKIYFRLKKQFLILLLDGVEFFPLFSSYIQRKLIFLGLQFEIFKKIIVDGLIIKRGRFARPFLHLGVGSLFTFGMIAAPVFASTYPIFSQKASLSDVPSPSAVLTSVTDGQPLLSTEVSPKPRDKIIVYKAEQGDTLSSIAIKFDISVDTILWENNLKVTDSLSIDQEIRILPVSGVSNKVLKGDTVYSIAKKYETDAQNIVNFPFNDFADPDTFALVPGQILIVPDGSPPQVKPVTPKTLPRFISPSELAAGVEGFVWPTTGSISQRPVWYHMAVDIANKEAPAVGAAKAGNVSYADCGRGGYGCHVIVDHGDGLQTLYGHFSQIAVGAGDTVSQGQVLGRMGSTGRSTGMHLHFEVRKNGVLLNPLNFLR